MDGDNTVRATGRTLASLAESYRERSHGCRLREARGRNAWGMAGKPRALPCLAGTAFWYVYRNQTRHPQMSCMVTESQVSSSVVFLESRVLLRLAQLPGAKISSLVLTLSRCVSRLEQVEHSIQARPQAALEEINAQTLHTSLNVGNEPSLSDIGKWGETVASLWKVSMLLSSESPEWDALSSRMLLWRCLVGDNCIEGEWVRKQTIELSELQLKQKELSYD